MEISPLQNVGDWDSKSIPHVAGIETKTSVGRYGKTADERDFSVKGNFCAKKEKMGIDIYIDGRYNHIVE